MSAPYIPYVVEEQEDGGFHVAGPGLAWSRDIRHGGWRGIMPGSHNGMTEAAAREFADILNCAYRNGSRDRAARIRMAIDGW